MNHERYRELLSALLDGELGEPERGEALSHLESCEICRRYFAELNAMRDAFGGAEEIDVPEGFAEGVLARLHAEDGASAVPEAAAQTAREKRILPRGLAALAACAAAALLAVTALPGMMGGSAAPESDYLVQSSSASPSAAAGTAAQDTAEPAAPEAAEERDLGESLLMTASGGEAEPTADASAANDEAVYGDAASAEPRPSLAPAEDGASGAVPEASNGAAVQERAVGPSETTAEWIGVTLSGEGAADWLLANGAQPGELDGEYLVDAAVLRELPERLTLGGEHAEYLPDLSGVTVSVRIAETEAVP